MTCRDIHATNAFSFIIAIVSVGGIAVATLIPQWRVTRLVTFNKNAKNVSVYDGLWAKCVKQDGYSGCYFYDSEWYSKIDQLDLRLLQFCLPVGLFLGSFALLLSMAGMCKTCCCSDKPEDIKTSRCLVNSAGCHLVAGMFLFLGGAIALAPSVWFLFRTKEMNVKYDRIFSDGFAVYVSIGCSGGLMLAALLMFMWYCMCKKLPSPFWLPVPTMSTSLSSQPLTANGFPPSPVYGPPGPFPPQGYAPTVIDAQPYGPLQAYPQSMAPPAQPQVYLSQISAPDGYGSEVGGNQAYSYAPSQTYAPSQGYASSYAGHRYSTRSRMSGIEIDIPLLTQ